LVSVVALRAVAPTSKSPAVRPAAPVEELVMDLPSVTVDFSGPHVCFM
jgi:hypothetical protein